MLECGKEAQQKFLYTTVEEKTGENHYDTEMARGARSGARYEKFGLAKTERNTSASFWWVCHLHTTNTSSWLYNQSIVKILC